MYVEDVKVSCLFRVCKHACIHACACVCGYGLAGPQCIMLVYRPNSQHLPAQRDRFELVVDEKCER